MGLFDTGPLNGPGMPTIGGPGTDPVRLPSTPVSGVGGPGSIPVQTPVAPTPQQPTLTPAPTAPTTPITATDPSVFWNQLVGMNPWIAEIGFDMGWFQNILAQSGENSDTVLMHMRSDARYKARFPGLWRPDGTIRMTESQYLNQETTYRQLFRQHGIDESAYQTPEDLAGLFDNEIDPNELNQRLDTYAIIRDGSQAVRDAFYVYAGLDLSTDDLFEAAIDPRMAAELSGVYRENAAGLDYPTFISRTAERALQGISAQLVDGVVSIDINGSQRLLDALYTNGGTDTSGTAPLSLQELLSSYQEAVLGAAASEAGLGMPTKERIQEIRAAGIQRAQAQQQYMQFGQQRGALSAAAERAGQGSLDRTDFENAAFLGNAMDARRFQTAEAYSQAVGQGGGGFRFDQGDSGLFQRGLTD